MRVVLQNGAVGFNPLQNRSRHRKEKAGRVKAAFGQHVVEQVAVQPAVAVFKRVNIDKTKGEDGGGDDRIKRSPAPERYGKTRKAGS